MHYRWGETTTKKGHGYFEQCTTIQKISAILIAVCWNNNRVVYVAFSESPELNRLSRRCNKVERKYIQEQ